jgi:Protein of unknown function (DUF2975)
MKRGSTIFLRVVVFIIAMIVLALCIFALPAGITSDRTGYYRPILLGMYITALPFFYALHQTLKLLHYVDTNEAFSELSVKAIKLIKYCAAGIGAAFAVAMPYIFIVADKDDAPGVIVLGLVIVLASVVIAVFAAVLQKLLQSAIDIKSENDLTV